MSDKKKRMCPSPQCTDPECDSEIDHGDRTLITVKIDGIEKLPLEQSVERLKKELKQMLARQYELQMRVVRFAFSMETYNQQAMVDKLCELSEAEMLTAMGDVTAECKHDMAIYLADFFELRRVWLLIQERMWVERVCEEQDAEVEYHAKGQPVPAQSLLRRQYHCYSNVVWRMFEFAKSVREENNLAGGVIGSVASLI